MVWELTFSHHTLWFALEACCEPEKCIAIRANMCLNLVLWKNSLVQLVEKKHGAEKTMIFFVAHVILFL